MVALRNYGKKKDVAPLRELLLIIAFSSFYPLKVTGSASSNNEKTLLLSDTEDEFQ